MAKLVGVVHDNEDPNSPSKYVIHLFLTFSTNNFYNSRCLARRQLPLTIEQDLTMIMALDDACLACCSSTLLDVDEKTSNEINSNMATFTRKYQALNR